MYYGLIVNKKKQIHVNQFAPLQHGEMCAYVCECKRAI